GYLRELRRHLYVFELGAKVATQVTAGPYDDDSPAWSPDGRSLAFTSNRTPEPDANDNTDVFVIAVPPPAAAMPVPRQLTTTPGADATPVFTADGRSVVFVQGGDPGDLEYGTNHLAVVPFAGGPPRPLTAELDRNVETPRPSPDGRFV